MKVVVQRVTKAAVSIDLAKKRNILQGMVVLVGIEQNDNHADVEWLAGKISQLRIFSDPAGLMNLSIQDIEGEIMIISQFTLHASTKKGNRPSYIRAAKPETAIPLYEAFIKQVEKISKRPVITGKFGANMQIEMINDGPVTIIIDSKNRE